MTSAPQNVRGGDALHVALPARPAWLEARLSASPAVLLHEDGDMRVEGCDAPGIGVLRATLHRAAALSDAELRSAVRRGYARLGRLLDDRGLFAWRFWNFVPGLLSAARIADNRYQVFNEGRYEALQDGSAEQPPFAAASAVGHRGDDLVIDLLAGATPGRMVDNPRQRPPWRYSERWGPKPPCFARATLVPGAPFGLGGATAALVSGTASIVGEESRHAGDLDAQLAETLTNLAVLAEAIAPARACYRRLRAYVTRAPSVECVLHGLRACFPRAEHVEVAVTDLCRPELLVEIEGLAQVDG